MRVSPLVLLWLAAQASAAELVEDFSTLTYADLSATTGVWNVVSKQAQAGAVADGSASRVISFGDGSDGVLESANGYAFDTDAHPNGFNFISVNITGGSITVTGSNPLVIRSLGAVNISPTLSVKGGDGSNGSVTTIAAAGSSGGVSVAGRSAGGKGGDAVSGAAALMNGGDGIAYDGNADVFSTGGAGGDGNPGTVDGQSGLSSLAGPGPNFDSGNFIAGVGGGGGGGHWAGADINHGTGGSGGAGGGTVRITAVGDITLGAVDARGGTGGDGVTTDSSCAGNGDGGTGGGVWLQSLAAITASSPPAIAGGSGGQLAVPPCVAAGGGNAGFIRADTPTQPAWAGTANDYDTANAAPSQTYIIQSKSYDLGTLNASFDESPVVASDTSSGGTVTVKYAGSGDNVSFSEFSSDIRDLSNRNYRYLKFQITIATAAAAAPSPEVSRIAVSYTDLGYDSVQLQFSPGCATTRNVNRSGDGGGNGSASVAWVGLAMIGTWRFFRRRSRELY